MIGTHSIAHAAKLNHHHPSVTEGKGQSQHPERKKKKKTRDMS